LTASNPDDLKGSLTAKAREARMELAFAAGNDPAIPGAAHAGVPPKASAQASDALSAANALAASENIRTPEPRPVAVAFAGSGLPAYEAPEQAAAKPTTPAPQPVARTKPAASPTANKMIVLASASAGEDDIASLLATEPDPATDEEIARPAAEAAMVSPALGMGLDDNVSLTLPQPRGASDLFRAPATAAHIATLGKRPKLQPGHFQTAQATAAENRGSFLSNLFGGWTE
jgi:hypothetical protein